MYLDEIAEAIRQNAGNDADVESPQLFRTLAVLVLAKGTKITNGDVHNVRVLRRQDVPQVPFRQLGVDEQQAYSMLCTAAREVAFDIKRAGDWVAFIREREIIAELPPAVLSDNWVG